MSLTTGLGYGAVYANFIIINIELKKADLLRQDQLMSVHLWYTPSDYSPSTGEWTERQLGDKLEGRETGVEIC